MRKSIVASILALATLPTLAVGAADNKQDITYTVTGVATGDTLNVRSGPGAKYSVARQLPNGTSNIRILGEPVTNGGDDWVPISFAGGKGWTRPMFLVVSQKPNPVANNQIENVLSIIQKIVNPPPPAVSQKPNPVANSQTQNVVTQIPTSARILESGRLTTVRRDGTTRIGTWTMTGDAAGNQTGLIWVIDGETVTFPMIGGSPYTGRTKAGNTVTATFRTDSSGTAKDNSTGEVVTFTASQTPPAVSQKPNLAPNSQTGRLTLVTSDGTNKIGTWTLTRNSAGTPTGLVWVIDGDPLTFRMTGGSTLTGRTNDGNTLTATFRTPSSGTVRNNSTGEVSTFTATDY